jgi:hypothetical protein
MSEDMIVPDMGSGKQRCFIICLWILKLKVKARNRDPEV